MTYLRWAPTGLLAVGCLLSLGLRPQLDAPLEQPLAAAVPVNLEGATGTDVPLSEEERSIIKVSDYLFRTYSTDGMPAGPASLAYSVYIGYYSSQTRVHTIHSPKNCLPGAGWEVLSSTTATIATASGPVVVNRFLLQHDKEQAVVLYWYQGRGRVEANEYRVKLNLLRDAAITRRSEEALVRVVVPIRETEAEAFQTGQSVAAQLVGSLTRVLPD